MASTITTIQDLHPDILSGTLRHMDGPTLAAAACSSSLLHSLSSDPSLWTHVCLATWPSLAHPLLLPLAHHRRLFSDSFPFPGDDNDYKSLTLNNSTCEDDDDGDSQLPTRLISAIDLYHNGVPVYSRVIDTDTSSSWFLNSPFRVDALDRKDPVDHVPPTTNEPPAVNPPDELTLSWIVIDLESNRAVNLSSRRPVAVDRHWYTGETLVRFVTVLCGFAVSVVVTCGEEMGGQVKEVSLMVEDADGRSASGRECLEIFKMAMEGTRRGTKWGERIKRRYEEYLRRKRERREKKVKREGMMDLCCTGFGALMFLCFIVLLAIR